MEEVPLKCPWCSGVASAPSSPGVATIRALREAIWGVGGPYIYISERRFGVLEVHIYIYIREAIWGVGGLIIQTTALILYPSPLHRSPDSRQHSSCILPHSIGPLIQLPPSSLPSGRGVRMPSVYHAFEGGGRMACKVGGSPLPRTLHQDTNTLASLPIRGGSGSRLPYLSCDLPLCDTISGLGGR